MTPPAAPYPQQPVRHDPAKDAARLLGWFGLTILMVGAPLVGVLSRRALFILLPIGAGLLFAAFFIAVSVDGLKALRAALAQPIGFAVAFLLFWMGLSLIWTPFPQEAIGRYGVTLTTALIAALIIAHMPERRARPTLYLLPAGVAVTGLVTLGMALIGPASFRGGTEFDPSLLERSILTLVVLVWPAIGALVAFRRFVLAMALAALVVAVAGVASARIAMAVFALAALAFAAPDPRRAAKAGAIIFGGLVLIAPLLPFALAPLAEATPMVGKSTVSAMTDWRDLIASDGLRLITGHGVDAARHGAEVGFLPGHTPRSILFEAWYDLGVLGALALATALALGFLATGGAAPLVAPALLAGMVATMAIAMFGVATAQVWFVTLVSLQAVAYGLLCRASRGTLPPATALDAAAPFGADRRSKS